MRIGFLVWNKFQVGHFAEIMRHFEEPDVIFIDREINGLSGFNPQWLARYGAYSRFLTETELDSLDGQYDAILTQFTPPLARPWKKTKLVMTQYSMAKPKTAYNARWLACDFGLVYGDFSHKIIGGMCPTSLMGNPRFDPLFENRLDQDVLSTLKSHLDPAKKTLAFLPTWGDLSSRGKFKEALDALLPHYNVIFKPHHMTSLKDAKEASRLGAGAIDAESLTNVLDIGPYVMAVADVVVSDMSGVIFDALYCRKPVALLALDQSIEDHKKADPTALEVAGADRIGPVVQDPPKMLEAVNLLIAKKPYHAANEALVAESFIQRGGCGSLVANGIKSFLHGDIPHHAVNDYAAPNVRGPLLSRAYLAATKRSPSTTSKLKPIPVQRTPNLRKELLAKKRSRLKRFLATLPAGFLVAAAKTCKVIGAPEAESFLYYRAVEAGGNNDAVKWVDQRRWRGTRKASKILLAPPTESHKQLGPLQDAGDFFAVGRLVENWSNLAPMSAKQALYNFYGAAGNVRFSRVRLRQLHQSLTSFARADRRGSASARRSIFRDLGFLDEAVEAGGGAPGDTQESLIETLVFVDELKDYLQKAALNEGLLPSERMALTPQGDWVPVGNRTDPIFEMSIMLSFTRALGKDDDGTRKAMMDVTRQMIEALRQDGWTILPRIQAGFRGSSTVSGLYPSATWHTTEVGILGQVHLKVGTLNSHIIIDDRGYSGWSSLARKDLESIIESVSAEDADDQIKHLNETLVEQGRSKFKQSHTENVPDIGPYIFFPMQIMTDSVAQLAHIDGITLLKALSQWGKNSKYKIVVKRHPKCQSYNVSDALRIEQRLGRIILSNAPIHSLIAGAEAVVTVNSGSGAEALLHLKPVITTGDSDYSAATALVRTKEKLFEALNRLPELPVSQEEIKRFLWVYSKHYQVHPDDYASVTARVRELIAPPTAFIRTTKEEADI